MAVLTKTIKELIEEKKFTHAMNLVEMLSHTLMPSFELRQISQLLVHHDQISLAEEVLKKLPKEESIPARLKLKIEKR